MTKLLSIVKMAENDGEVPIHLSKLLQYEIVPNPAFKYYNNMKADLYFGNVIQKSIKQY